jgi:hypothetical protein
VLLVVDEPLYPVSFRESRNQALAMLEHAAERSFVTPTYSVPPGRLARM